VVGHGRIEVQARVPGQPPFGVAARLLVFNGRTRKGRTALLLHAYAQNPRSRSRSRSRSATAAGPSALSWSPAV